MTAAAPPAAGPKAALDWRRFHRLCERARGRGVAPLSVRPCQVALAHAACDTRVASAAIWRRVRVKDCILLDLYQIILATFGFEGGWWHIRWQRRTSRPYRR